MSLWTWNSRYLMAATSFSFLVWELSSLQHRVYTCLVIIYISTISTYLLPPANLTDLPMLLTGFCLQLPAKLVAEVSSVIRVMRGL